MANYYLDLCGRLETVTVEFTGATPTIGDVYSIYGTRGELFCGVVDSISTDSPTYTAETLYNSCMDCITGTSTSNYFRFKECGTEAVTVIVSPLELGFLPNVGDIYELSLTDKGVTKVLCYEFLEVVYTSSAPSFVTLNSQTLYSSCELCAWEGNSVVVQVERCGYPDEFYYVQVPTTAGPFISFIPNSTLDQYCGEIITTSTSLPDSTYLTSFDDCNICTGQTTVKRELISCLDGSIEVVYTSALYGVGESGFVRAIDPLVNLETCYEIGNLTEYEVTITDYLQYFPSQSCDECFSCNPIGIEYIPCNWEGAPLTATTYQYVQTNPNQLFLHPIYGCSYVTKYFNPIDGSELIYSFVEFDGDCGTNDCLLYEYETWLVETCVGSEELPLYGYISVPPGVFTTGDTTMVRVGLYDDFCVTLIEDTEDPGRYDFVGTTNQINYGDCTTCLEQRLRGITIVNCKTYEVKKVKLPESIIQLINNFGPFFKDNNLDCYYILDDCYKDESVPLISVVEIFSTCEDCNAPKSANTPTYICNYCCDCGASGETITQIVPEYPVWTDGYGQAVIQTNMVVIGRGFNG